MNIKIAYMNRSNFCIAGFVVKFYCSIVKLWSCEDSCEVVVSYCCCCEVGCFYWPCYLLDLFLFTILIGLTIVLLGSNLLLIYCFCLLTKWIRNTSHFQAWFGPYCKPELECDCRFILHVCRVLINLIGSVC